MNIGKFKVDDIIKLTYGTKFKLRETLKDIYRDLGYSSGCVNHFVEDTFKIVSKFKSSKGWAYSIESCHYIDIPIKGYTFSKYFSFYETQFIKVQGATNIIQWRKYLNEEVQ